VEWKQHWVIGKKYISILDLDNEKLTITTMKEIKKLSKKRK